MVLDIEATRKFLRTCIEFNYYAPYAMLTVETYNDFVRRELIQWFWSNKDKYCVNTHCNWPELVKYVNMTWDYIIEVTEGRFESDVVKQCACNVDKRIHRFKNHIRIENEHVTDRSLISDNALDKLQEVWNKLLAKEIYSWTDGLTKLNKKDKYALM